jgi:hypothetical protein
VTIGAGRIAVWIATTEGICKVQRVARERPEVRSVICLDGGTQALPVSAAYDAFVREPTGVIERAVGHPVFRVDLSAAIDEGSSWQLGLFLAHELENTVRLAPADDPTSAIIWATGEVDRDLTLRPVAHVAEKVQRALPQLLDAVRSGRRVILALPSRNQDDLPRAELPKGVEVVCASTIREVLAVIRAPEQPSAPVKRQDPVLIAALVVVLLAAMAWAGNAFDARRKLASRWADPPTQTVQAPAAVAPVKDPVPEPAKPAPPPPAVVKAPVVEVPVLKVPVLKVPGVKPVEAPKPAIVAKAPAPTPKPAPAPAKPAPPRFDADLVAVELIEWRPLSRADCDRGEQVATPAKPGNPTSAICRSTLRLRDTGKMPAVILMAADIAEGRAEYMRADKYRDQFTGTLLPGGTVELSLKMPSWVRREMAFRMVAAVADAAAHEAGLKPILAAIMHAGSVDFSALPSALPEATKLHDLTHTLSP